MTLDQVWLVTDDGALRADQVTRLRAEIQTPGGHWQPARRPRRDPDTIKAGRLAIVLATTGEDGDDAAYVDQLTGGAGTTSDLDYLIGELPHVLRTAAAGLSPDDDVRWVWLDTTVTPPTWKTSTGPSGAS